ncbi:MAG: bifunctional riboflavin kinase/FAD synthetase [Acholeplasmataceae bacterium]
MKIIRKPYEKMTYDHNLTLTIGNFDGLHLGHQKLIETVQSFHDSHHGVLTFDPHPMTVLRKKPFYILTKPEDKIDILKSFSLDVFFLVDFSQALQMLSIDGFIAFLKDLSVIRLVLGRDFRFATKGSGSIEDLKAHFDVVIVEDILYNQMRISSTYIKDLLDQAHIGEVRKLLTRHFEIKGQIVHGNHIGKSLGFPTANIDYDHYYLPANGVYYVKVGIHGEFYDAMANIGNNPTLNYSLKKRLEIYILDFNQNIYGQQVSVKFYHYLRAEQKFENKDALIAQLKNDEQVIRKLTLS